MSKVKNVRNDTLVTYTNVNEHLKNNSLIQPTYIDTVHAGDVNRKSRFTSKLHNTFLIGEVIVAVWLIDLYVCDIED